MPLVLTKEDRLKVRVCNGHTRPICHVCFSPVVDTHYWFVTSCHDKLPMIRYGATGDWVGTFEGHRGAVYCSSFNSDAARIVTGSGDFSVKLWNAIVGTNLHTWNTPHYVKCCDWWQSKVVTGCFDSQVRVFDVNNYATEPVSFRGDDKDMIKAVFFGDNHSIITAAGSQVKLWDTRTNDAVRSVELKGLNVVDYTHQHNLVAAHGTSITLLDPQTLATKGSFDTTEDVECGTISPDGRTVAVGSKIKVKEFTIDGSELESHRGHHGPVFHLRYAPDGNTIVSGSEDGMARIWPSHHVILQCQD